MRRTNARTFAARVTYRLDRIAVENGRQGHRWPLFQRITYAELLVFKGQQAADDYAFDMLMVYHPLWVWEM